MQHSGEMEPANGGCGRSSLEANRINVAISVAAFLLGAWYVGHAILKQAAATQDIASAVDCSTIHGDDAGAICHTDAAGRRDRVNQYR